MKRNAVIHLDADAFFASVEQAADPRLRGKPVAVGGQSRGVVTCASCEARKFGIYTPMPSARALKLCPKLILLPGQYDLYEEFSSAMFAYAYTDEKLTVWDQIRITVNANLYPNSWRPLSQRHRKQLGVRHPELRAELKGETPAIE